MILVSWTHESAGPLVRGTYPAGLTHEDFAKTLDTESVDNTYIGYYTGDADIADFGMSSFEYPDTSVPVFPITVTAIDGVLSVDEDFANVVCREKETISISADLPLGVDDTFLVQLERTDTGRVILALAEVVDNKLSIFTAFPTSGIWKCSEESINNSLVDKSVSFSFAGITFSVVL
jgi:hypothetical protein